MESLLWRYSSNSDSPGIVPLRLGIVEALLASDFLLCRLWPLLLLILLIALLKGRLVMLAVFCQGVCRELLDTFLGIGNSSELKRLSPTSLESNVPALALASVSML